MNLPLFIAKRYIVSKKTNNAINIISWISIVSIAIGTAALVIILSATNGLTQLVENLYNSFDPDLEITIQKGKNFIPSEAHLAAIKKQAGIKAFYFSLEDDALLKYKDKQTVVTVLGVDENFKEATRFDTLIQEGQFHLKQGAVNRIVLGKGIAYRLGLGLNDIYTPISLMAPKRGAINEWEGKDQVSEIKIKPSGFFSLNDDFDFKYCLIDLKAARALLDYEKEVSAINVALQPGTDPEEVKEALVPVLGKDFVVKTKEEQNEVLFKSLRTEKFFVFIILAFILVIATFNVIGALTMLIIEKQKDIQVLSFMGADRSLVQKIFMHEGLLLTTLGALVGLFLGTVVCWSQMQFGWLKLEAGYIVDAYPVKMMSADFVAILLVVIGIGLATAWYPVRVFARQKGNM